MLRDNLKTYADISKFALLLSLAAVGGLFTIAEFIEIENQAKRREFAQLTFFTAVAFVVPFVSGALGLVLSVAFLSIQESTDEQNRGVQTIPVSLTVLAVLAITATVYTYADSALEITTSMSLGEWFFGTELLLYVISYIGFFAVSAGAAWLIILFWRRVITPTIRKRLARLLRENLIEQGW